MEQQQHEMILEKSHPTGADEWYCPTCGRRFVMDYEPRFKKTVLEVGDEYAIHSGGKGGLRIGSMQVTPADKPASHEEATDPRLAFWSAWLEDSDFDNLWTKDQ
jgi:hypothetical protein